MGFSSIPDLLSEISIGKFHRVDSLKNTITASSNTWMDFSSATGNPPANTYPGTALTWQGCDEATGNGTTAFGLRHGGNVSPDTKHIVTIGANTNTSSFLSTQLMLVDLQGYWPGISTNTAVAQTLSGTPTLRYTNGVGVRAYLVQTAAGGSTAQNVTYTYTDNAGNTGNVAANTAMTSSAVAGQIAHSSASGTNFLPFNSGDIGIRNVASVTFSAAKTGTVALCLARPLLTISFGSGAATIERDLLNQLFSMPRVVDGACLTWLVLYGSTAPTTQVLNTYIEVAWG
jgi:hypothetical protein